MFLGSHNLTCGHIWWRKYGYVYMTISNNITYNPDFECLTSFAHQFTSSNGNIVLQYVISVLGNTYKMILNISSVRLRKK